MFFALALAVGTPVALLTVDAPVTTIALSLVGDDAAAQAARTPTPDTGGGGSREPRTGNNGNAIPSDVAGGDGASGVATLHDLVTIGTTSDTSMTLSDSPTGDINNVVIYNIEDTNETVVINNAGNPGSTGNHMMNVGSDPQAINTGGNNNIANSTNLSDSVLCNGSFNGGGNAPTEDARSRTGADGFGTADAIGGDPRMCTNKSESPDIRN